MDKKLQEELANVLNGNGEAALVMGRRYLSEETLHWAMGANYECPGHDYDVRRFIEAWRTNTDYEITIDGSFDGGAAIAVGHQPGLDMVKVTLHEVTDEYNVPGLYASLLRHAADWIEKNADAVRNRQPATIQLD